VDVPTEGDLSDLQEPHDAHEPPAERIPNVSPQTEGKLFQVDVKDGASTNRPPSVMSNASSDVSNAPERSKEAGLREALSTDVAFSCRTALVSSIRPKEP
jgi:hypothetical protein